MIILGIETSCDETAAAVVKDAREVLSNVVYTQIARHRPYGGVVPEIASRCHVEVLPDILRDAVRNAGITWGDLDGIAVTRGPGLVTSLLIGVTAAKALAGELKLPWVGVNHMEAHLYSIFLSNAGVPAEELFPMVVLMVSGGHTSLVRVDGIGAYEWLGETLDDAAGEALDKGANLLGLGYPGGPVIEKAAQGGRFDAIRFPRGLANRSAAPFQGSEPEPAFSFSGLKTALLYYLRDHPEGTLEPGIHDVAASYQEAVFDSLVSPLEKAVRAHRPRSIGCSGGVARNQRLRGKLKDLSERMRLPLFMAGPEFCTDNAAMVAALAGAKWAELSAGMQGEVEVEANLPLVPLA